MEEVSLTGSNSFSPREILKSTSPRVRTIVPKPVENIPYFLAIKQANNDLVTQFDPVSSLNLLLLMAKEKG